MCQCTKSLFMATFVVLASFSKQGIALDRIWEGAMTKPVSK